jgi:hypothetical protein
MDSLLIGAFLQLRRTTRWELMVGPFQVSVYLKLLERNFRVNSIPLFHTTSAFPRTTETGPSSELLSKLEKSKSYYS